MHMPVNAMLAIMDSDEIADWKAYFEFKQERTERQKQEQKELEMKNKMLAFASGKKVKK